MINLLDLREIVAKKTRFILAILAIAWGTASIASMLAIGEGLRLSFEHIMSSTGKALLYITPGQTTLTYQGQAINQTLKLTSEDLRSLYAHFPHLQILPEYHFQGRLVYGDHQSTTLLNGVEPAYGKLRYIIPRTGGRFINAIDMQSRDRVIILGNKLGEELAPHRNLLGQFIFIYNQKFQVIGIMKNKLQFWSAGIPDSYVAWIPASTYQGLFHPSTIDRIIIAPEDPQTLSNIKVSVLNILAVNHHLDPQDKNLAIFLDSGEIQQKTHRLFVGMEIFLGIIGGLNLIVAGTGLANIMFITVRRSTREIGIRMAIGARKGHILFQYLLESLIITGIGGLVGLLSAILFMKSIEHIPFKPDFLKSLGNPQPELSPFVISIVMITLGLTGLLAGFFPAQKAASTPPAEALRYE